MVRKIDFGKITEEIKKREVKDEFVDPIKEKLFQPKLKDGVYQAIIRFLPRHVDDTDMIPYVKLMNHVFKTKSGQWVYENCPTTFGKNQKCPICEKNSEEWEDESKRDELRKRTRRTHYYSNILVVNDPQNPENNGKVFIYRYGKKIFDLILEKISPDDNGIDEPVSVFDYTEGQNFKLKMRQVGTGKDSWPNYDQSCFTGTSSPVYNTDEEINELDEKLHMLNEIVSVDKFKSYDEIKKSFEMKMGFVATQDKDVNEYTIEPELPTKSKKQQVVTEEEKDSFDDEDDFLNELEDD